MRKELLIYFNAFRKWFNRMFSLSLVGMFKGLCTLSLYVDFYRFAYRLYKILNGCYRNPVSDVICFHLSGPSIKFLIVNYGKSV